MSRTYARNHLRQTHITMGDSIVKIDDKALAMNDPNILRADPRLRNARIMIVDNNWQDTEDGYISRQVDLIISQDGRVLFSKLDDLETPEYEDIKIDNGVVRFIVPKDKQLLKRLARKIVI